MLRTIVEAPEYTEQLKTLGDIRELDESLRALMWGLHTQAEKYKLIPGFHNLRIAKDLKINLRIFFQIEPIQGKQVTLRWIERLDEPSILYDDDDDEP